MVVDKNITAVQHHSIYTGISSSALDVPALVCRQDGGRNAADASARASAYGGWLSSACHAGQKQLDRFSC